jgi:hypothetical protein
MKFQEFSMRQLFSLLPLVALLFNSLPAHALTMDEAMEKYKVRETIRDLEKERKNRVARGQLISVDTRDQESCAKVRNPLPNSPT